jgi:hypothetical protein
MSTSESFEALRRANPRAAAGFAESVDSAAAAVRAGIVTTPTPARRSARRRLVPAAAAGLAVAAVAVFAVTAAPRGGAPVVESASAAIRHAATLTAASAEGSGTALVRMTHDGDFWAGRTIRWNGDDLSVHDLGSRPSSGGRLLVVGGMMYGPDPEHGGWLALGSPDSIDPGSGTMPADYLVAVREDVGGETLQRISDGMRELTRRALDDGSTVYSGTVAAGLIARETGFKEGHSIRVFPFGYVAHDEAADPEAQLETAVTVRPDGIIRQIGVSWGTWTYTVAYSGLGATAAPVAPAHARSLLGERLRAVK